MPIGDLLAQISGESGPTSSTSDLPSKRKAEIELRKLVGKVQRTEAPAANSSRPISQLNRPSAVKPSNSNIKLATNPVQSPTATFKNGQPTPPPSSDATAAKPPKKGSYAEIMARGKAAQATLGQVGKIQHKKIEKLPSKREREDIKAQKSQRIQKNIASNGKFRSAGQIAVGRDRTDRDGVRKPIAKAAPEPEKKVKKAATATTGYSGTARPKPSGSNGPSKLSSASRYDRGSDRYRDRYGTSSKRYTYASEEDDEAAEEDYDSNESSDMEAAAFEVDEEEEEAARIARREDAEALAEENQHKREKEEKKRRLAAMAKRRR